ncbi:riboflavin biosynthesis protein RibF [Streptobacillus felis]|uniref:Riboflavin biosynthesis protein n=1 Tax=Streptobacillus felis TaxID=1384509 RepID=A0A7Z0PDW5_9FUSO|nr:riboflavin biosynthesis protein RibF [Streptobacillus felis]NYV27372.1 riboflavin biosynthesis protein RibF [Streptobacillus felis]
MKIILKDISYAEDFAKFSNNKILRDIVFKEKNIVVLGNFDGVHLGHHEIISKALELGKKLNQKVLIYTFKEYPKKRDTLITTLSEKLYIFDKLKIDYVYLEDFYDVNELSPEDFVDKILLEKLNASEIFCGFNYTFGSNKKGDVVKLKELLKDKINVNVINPILFNLKTDELKIVEINELKEYLDRDYCVISSTFIKTLIENGKMNYVQKLLGHKYIIMGKVVHGKKLARTLGFPTANLSSKNKIYPLFAVYGVKIYIENDKNEYYGIMNIGKNPTIENEGLHIETHIFDFNQDIYDKIIVVELFENIRLEKRMGSLEELKNQILMDTKIWKEKINDEY